MGVLLGLERLRYGRMELLVITDGCLNAFSTGKAYSNAYECFCLVDAVVVYSVLPSILYLALKFEGL